MKPKFDHSLSTHSIDTASSKLDSPQSLRQSSPQSSCQSLPSTGSDISRTDVSSIADDQVHNDHVSDTAIKTSSTDQPIKDCKNNNKLSFGISRLLSSSKSKLAENQLQHGDRVHSNSYKCLDFENSNNLELDSLKGNDSLTKYEKPNDTVLKLPVHQYHLSSINYPNPYSWLGPQVTTSFIPKNRLSGKHVLILILLK